MKDGDPSKIVWLRQPFDEFFWETESGVQAVIIGDGEPVGGKMTAEFSYSDLTKRAIFDTGTSYIYAPKLIGSDLILRYLEGKQYLFSSVILV
mmetsp:Transcript_23492/g.36181  ORF Transcript_23492/g.36181 Transcript_23492/m.36181 type:complete len:93 (+) Transcript_23492:138-416(+)